MMSKSGFVQINDSVYGVVREIHELRLSKNPFNKGNYLGYSSNVTLPHSIAIL